MPTQRPHCAFWCCRFGPPGTDNYTEEQLAALVTRDAMIGVVTVNVNEQRAAA